MNASHSPPTPRVAKLSPPKTSAVDGERGQQVGAQDHGVHVDLVVQPAGAETGEVVLRFSRGAGAQFFPMAAARGCAILCA